MSADRNDRVVVVLGTTTPEIDATLRALALAPLDEGNEHATVWLPAEKVARPDPPPEDDAAEPTSVPLLVTIAEAAIALGIGRSTVYDLIATGELEVVHIGRAARVPSSALQDLVVRLHRRGQPASPFQSVPLGKVQRAGSAGSSQR